ncbi:adhesion G protein-coupled receptor L4-like [Stylophora pistillata]|uniref:adhesion G protein-coupled receptor L4-like n=1 Tax=Stylophora pistillata TaxID=50429 RepID=UPI000C03E110|nr:adhesion G protein-coupled receptor L4-like [Stylophora pistillata]
MSVYTTVDAFQSFVITYGWYHLNESIPFITKTYDKIRVLRIRKGFKHDSVGFHISESRSGAVDIPSTNFERNGSVVVGIVYKDLHELLRTRYSTNTTNGNRSSLIIASAMDPKPGQLKRNVLLKFTNQEINNPNRICVFWEGFQEETSNGWSNKGCHEVVSERSLQETVCSCNHLTHFAVLFDFGDTVGGGMSPITKTDEKTLTTLTYIGLTLSIVGIILTIISYALFTDVRQPLSQVRLSLAASLGTGQIVFLAGINATGNEGVCVAVASLIQYFFMSAFCWMLVEGIFLYMFVVKVYNIEGRMAIYHIFSWGLPAIMVSISLTIASAIDGIHSFVGEKYCWLSQANHLIWIFAALLVIVEVANVLVLARVIREIIRMQSPEENHQIRICIKTCVVMTPLLGIMWLFGLFSSEDKTCAYIHTVFSSTQGFLVFLLHCVRNTQIKERFKKRLIIIFPAKKGIKPDKKLSQYVQTGRIGPIPRTRNYTN